MSIYGVQNISPSLVDDSSINHYDKEKFFDSALYFDKIRNEIICYIKVSVRVQKCLFES